MMKYPNLFSPITIRGVTYPNRIFSAPMTFRDLPGEGDLTSEAVAFYELRAMGGAAEVTVSELTVHGQTGRTYPNNTSADSPSVKVGLAVAADSIRRHGAVPCVELNHGGKFSVTREMWGPSEYDHPDGRHVNEMSHEMIRFIVEEYARAAALVRSAGFRSLLIHGGHGWLLHQFLSPCDNFRTDKYGGSLKNRSRLALEILEAVRGAVGDGFPIEMRVSAEEYRDGGYAFDDLAAFAELIQDRVDLLQISTGSHENSFYQTHQTMFVPRGGLVKYAAAVKERLRIPVAAIGAIAEPEMAEEIIRSGKADIVVMGRQLLADPYFPRKAMAGKDDEIVRCCRCFTCQGERMVSGLRVCALNPVIGRELEAKYVSAARTPKKVLVAGGGPAGIMAAITAANMNHEVTLCERSGELGGALKDEAAISFKSDLYRWIAVKTKELYNAGVKVLLNTPVTRELAGKLAPDVLIAAVGTVPAVPRIPGIEGKNVIMAGELAARESEIGQRVVVIGGGLVGCEAALSLAMKGKDVSVIEMLPRAAQDANPRHGPILLDLLAKKANVYTNMKALEVRKDGLLCVNGEGEEVFFGADTIICAAGRRPLRSEILNLAGAAPRVIEIGDCIAGGNMMHATSQGYAAGLSI